MRDMINNKYYNEYKFYTKSMIEFELYIMNDYEDYKNYKQEPLSDEWYEEKDVYIYMLNNFPKWRWVLNYLIQLPNTIRYTRMLIRDTIGNWIVDTFNKKNDNNINNNNDDDGDELPF